MIKVSVLPTSSAYDQDKLFDLSSSLNRDNLLQVWHDFRESCLSMGWEVSTFDKNNGKSADVYFVIDPAPSKLCLLEKDQLKRSIVQFSEPADIAPEQYTKANLAFVANNCHVAFCSNEDLCEQYGFMHIPWYVEPYIKREDNIMKAKKRKGVCMIATNKFKRHNLSKLDFRLDLVKELSGSPETSDHFVLYGRYWLSAIGKLRRHVPDRIAAKLDILDKIMLRIERKVPYNNDLRSACKGVVQSKGEVLSKMRFNLVAENMFWDGYVSEKIFDALQFGCVPIYFGAGDVTQYVPKSIFINGRSFSKPSDAVIFALSLDNAKINEMIESGQKWLNSAGFESKFSRISYIEKLKKAIIGVVNNK